MEVTITVCVALGTLFLGWFFTLIAKPTYTLPTWITLLIGSFFYLVALFFCFKKMRNENREQAEREKREKAREQREIDRAAREEEEHMKRNPPAQY